jgi:hypothetical protein
VRTSEDKSTQKRPWLVCGLVYDPKGLPGGTTTRPRVARVLHLSASLCWVKHDHLIAGGALGGDATQLLERAPEEVMMSALLRALCTAFGWHTHASLVGLVVNLRFIASSLLLPWHGLG